MTGRESPSQLVAVEQRDILNLCVQPHKHVHLDEFFQPPKSQYKIIPDKEEG